MKELRNLVDEYLKKSGMWTNYKKYLVVEEWEQVVGQEIAAVTRPQKIIKNKIWITVKDSTWSYHLSMMKPLLLEKINERNDSERISEIYFKVGELLQEKMPDKGISNSKIVGQKDKQEISEFIRGINRLKKMDVFK